MRVRLVMMRGGARVREVPLKGPEVVIGRMKGCALRISAHEVSRKHCRIRESGDKVTVLDLGSANGTFVNGRQIAGETMLLPGDQLLVGPVLFLVEPEGKRVVIKPAGKSPDPDADTIDAPDGLPFAIVDRSGLATAEDLVDLDEIEIVDDAPEALPRADQSALPRADRFANDDVEELPMADLVDDPPAKKKRR